MARDKATITVDRAKLSEARVLLSVSSASAAIDVALSQLIHRYRVLNDVKAYSEMSPTVDEAAIGLAKPDWRDLEDDTDWDSEWPEDR